MTESEAPGGDQRRGGTAGTLHPHGTRRFVFGHLRREEPASLAQHLAMWCLAKHVVRVDASLCPDGQLSAASVVSLINGGEDIKTSSISDVYRTQWAGRDVVVKRYNHVGLGHSLRHSIKGSRARRSWTNGQRLLQLGIPTPRPLAYIDEYRGALLWRSYIVTEFVDGRRLSELLEDDRVPHGAKRRLISQVLRLIDRLSVHGINHGDMKHTNILCLPGKVVLTDLDSVETHGWEWLHRRRQAVDMVRFLRDLKPPQNRSDATGDFLDASSNSLSVSERDLVERLTAAGRLRLREDLQNTGLEEAFLAGQEEIRRRYSSTPVESSPGSCVLRLRVLWKGADRVIYFKEYVRRSAWDSVKDLFRPCRAMRAFRASRMLADAGFLVPTVVAEGSVGDGPLARRSFLATAEVQGARRIDRCLVAEPHDGAACSLQDRRDLLRSLGRTIGRMHGMGIVHGDLRPGNVLARKGKGGWEFFFIDNERTRKRRRLSKHLRLKNLVQINMLPWGISQTDRFRFFRAYMLMNPPVCLHYRRWAVGIMAGTYQRLLRLRNRGRLGRTTWRLDPAGK
jgi:tRNA A-37 threonylcarbamoyl transferase component Bud32